MSRAKMEPAEVAGGPELLLRGAFSLYKTPAGGLVLSFRPDGQDTDEIRQIPPAVLKMAMAAAGGKGSLGKLAGMFGGPGG